MINSKKIDDIYYKMEKEVYDTFNSSKIILKSSYFENGIEKRKRSANPLLKKGSE